MKGCQTHTHTHCPRKFTTVACSLPLLPTAIGWGAYSTRLWFTLITLKFSLNLHLHSFSHFILVLTPVALRPSFLFCSFPFWLVSFIQFFWFICCCCFCCCFCVWTRCLADSQLQTHFQWCLFARFLSATYSSLPCCRLMGDVILECWEKRTCAFCLQSKFNCQVLAPVNWWQLVAIARIQMICSCSCWC